MKKCLIVILAVLLCGGILSGSLAEGQGLYEYTVKGKKAVITAVTDKSIEKAEIPAEIDGYKVAAIGEDAFADCENLKTVTIPEGVQKIDNWAFENCSELSRINIPNSVTTLGEVPFAACFRLGSVTISPDHKVYGVSNDALYRKKDKTLLRFLAQYATGVEPYDIEYKVTDGIQCIGEEAFDGTKLTSIILPASVRKIDRCAFVSCYFLKEMVIPEGVKTIGDQVFMCDSALESVTIPDSVTKIGKGIFSSCTSLKNINISPKHRYYETKDLLLIEKKTRTIISASAAIEGEYTIPDDIRAIGNTAFQGCAGLSELTIPDSVKSIGRTAFWNCDHIIIKGHAGSVAQKFCEENEMRFEVIE
ncbi:MAG: leucine-rich repeat domain-containing protein [Clostridia bacterium]|nr:leucine-rich repeat domain-containing protein [Clostridia bacterium]